MKMVNSNNLKKIYSCLLVMSCIMPSALHSMLRQEFIKESFSANPYSCEKLTAEWQSFAQLTPEDRELYLLAVMRKIDQDTPDHGPFTTGNQVRGPFTTITTINQKYATFNEANYYDNLNLKKSIDKIIKQMGNASEETCNVAIASLICAGTNPNTVMSPLSPGAHALRTENNNLLSFLLDKGLDPYNTSSQITIPSDNLSQKDVPAPFFYGHPMFWYARNLAAAQMMKNTIKSKKIPNMDSNFKRGTINILHFIVNTNRISSEVLNFYLQEDPALANGVRITKCPWSANNTVVGTPLMVLASNCMWQQKKEELKKAELLITHTKNINTPYNGKTPLDAVLDHNFGSAVDHDYDAFLDHDFAHLGHDYVLANECCLQFAQLLERHGGISPKFGSLNIQQRKKIKKQQIDEQFSKILNS